MRWWIIVLVLLLNVYGSVGQALPDLVPYTDGKLWGYADTNGKVVMAPKWHSASLFNNDRAVVSFKDSSLNARTYYCIINKEGGYIIPPEYKWEGVYKGLSYGYGNMTTADGRRALVDSNGVIERVASNEPLRYGVVGQPGRLGFMDTNGKLLLPYRYSAISMCCNVHVIGAVIVRDTGEALKRHNSSGLMRLDGKEILPMKYHDIYYEPETDFGKGFRVSRRTNDGTNEPVKMEYLWIDYETGKQRKLQPGWGGIVTYKKAEGYFLRNDAVLVSKKKKVLLDGRRVQYVLPDTIFVNYSEHISSDTERVITQYIHTQTLKPYGPADTFYYYVNRSRFNGSVQRTQHQSWHYEGLPDINVGGRRVKEMYKDSFLFTVDFYRDGITHNNVIILKPGYQIDPSGRKNIEVRGHVHHNPQGGTYSAVVDDQGRYIIHPIRDFNITSYNKDDGLVVVNSTNSVDYCIYDSNGKVMCLPNDRKVSGAFYSKGQILTYAVLTELQYRGDSMWGKPIQRKEQVLRLADSMGNVLPQTAHYNIFGVYTPNWVQQGLVVKDSVDRLGIIDVDGSVLFPAIHFKYKSIRAVDENFAVVTDSANIQRVVYTANNKEIINVKGHIDIMQAGSVGNLANGILNRTSDVIVPGIYELTWSEGMEHKSVYIDYKGRIYGTEEFLEGL